MKVVLTKDVARLGRKSEIKEVPDGHALNFLIPRGFAKPATAENIKRVEEIKHKHSEQEENEKEAFLASLKVLENAHVEMVVEANDKGHLFKGIHEKEIAEAFSKNENVSIKESYVSITQPIKEVGEHTIELSCGDKKGEATLLVVSK